MRAWMIVVALLGAARAGGDECPLPEIRLSSAAIGDRWADFARSREVVRLLIAAAQRDATRDRSLVGSELPELGTDSRRVTFEVLSLAIRLRQLDCAVWRGVEGASLYRAFVDDARGLLESLAGAELAAREHQTPPLGELLSPEQPDARRPLGSYLSGGFGIAFGTSLMIGGLALSFDLGSLSPRSSAIAVDTTLWAAGAASTVAGVILIAKARRPERSARPK